MKVYRECIICVLNQIIRLSDYLNLDEKCKNDIMKKSLKRASKYDYLNLTPPEFSEFLYDIVIKETGKKDPYEKLKKSQNNLILDKYQYFEKSIELSEEPLYRAASLALAGNIIDYGGVKTFKIDMKEFEKIKIDIDDFKLFENKLKKAKSMLYIADNAGEAVFDKLFIKEIKNSNNNLDIFYAVKSKPAINDVVRKDAEYIGIDEFAEIIESGMGIPGTVIEKADENFRSIFENADIVISKGQGNFETLESEKREILFIFKVKCKIVADHSGIKQNSNVFAFNNNLKKHIDTKS